MEEKIIIKEQIIECNARLTLLENKFDRLLELLEQEGVMRKDDMDKKSDE